MINLNCFSFHIIAILLNLTKTCVIFLLKKVLCLFESVIGHLALTEAKQNSPKNSLNKGGPISL